MSAPNLNALWARVIMDALAAAGVRHVVVSPGSRSTPLALAAHGHADLQVVVHAEERAAGFFALGQAIGARAPIALVCTSGTAAANYLPAVIEASASRIPLVVLTADRPPSLRQVGAPQTIDQLHLYGHAVRRFQELPMPEPGALAAMAGQVALAIAAAGGPLPGPVHLNVPFAEPLAPIPDDAERVALLDQVRRPAPRILQAPALASDAALDEVAARLNHSQRPLIVAGTGPADVGGAALVALAEAAGSPLLADVGSGLRGLTSPVLLAGGDAFLRRPDVEAPDLVLRLGGVPTGKGINTYLAQHRAPTIALQPDLQGRDPEAQAELVVIGEVADAARRLTTRVQHRPADWLARWREADARVTALLSGEIPDEARALVQAVGAAPPGTQVCFSNSLPIRHAETYLDLATAAGKHYHVFRGANGIDGITSAALGIGRAARAPTLLVTGDLAFLHDLSGLQAARNLTVPLVILVLNNDGGGIFSYLPIASATDAFEPLFGTPHGLHFRHAAAQFGLAYTHTTEPAEAVAAGLATPGVSVVEVPAERARTAAQHQAFIARVLGQVELAR